MSLNYFVIAYDIKSVKRLNRVRKFLKKICFAVEESVFLLEINDYEFFKLDNYLKELKKLINTKRDEVGCYEIKANQKIISYGRKLLTDGCFFLPLNKKNI